MTLVPCLYTGFPGELTDPDTGRTVLLVPNETVVSVSQEVADNDPRFQRAETDAQRKAREKAERLKAEQDKAAEEAAAQAAEEARARVAAEQAKREQGAGS